MDLRLEKMTKNLMRTYFLDFEHDLAVYKDPQQYRPYVYSVEASDRYYDRQAAQNRIHLAVILNEEPIGEIILKNIQETKCCTLSIHLKNDSVKNKGYGTTAEILALQYAFEKLAMDTVYADALKENPRSCHVLKKAGFVQTHQDESYCYYKCERATWTIPIT